MQPKMDGSNNNRYFMNNLVNPSSARMLKYICTDVYDVAHKIAMTQDFKKNSEFFTFQ